jgi:hypothetical protein
VLAITLGLAALLTIIGLLVYAYAIAMGGGGN